MCWAVSRLVLLTWRNRVNRLLRRYPALGIKDSLENAVFVSCLRRMFTFVNEIA